MIVNVVFIVRVRLLSFAVISTQIKIVIKLVLKCISLKLHVLGARIRQS